MAKKAKTRYHEAGHVLVAHKFGIDTKYVDIGVKEKGEERGSSGLTRYSLNGWDNLSIEERLAICFAGDIAERRYSGVVPQSSGGDAGQALLTVLIECENDKEAEMFWKIGYELAEDIVEKYWDEIEKLADLFMENQVTEYPMEKIYGESK